MNEFVTGITGGKLIEKAKSLFERHCDAARGTPGWIEAEEELAALKTRDGRRYLSFGEIRAITKGLDDDAMVELTVGDVPFNAYELHAEVDSDGEAGWLHIVAERAQT